MRIRSTKPEFWRSNRIASVSWDARLVLKGLESYVDDNGVGKDDVELIIGDLFQRDAIREPSRTLARVSAAVTELHRAGLLWRYEADGTALLFVSFWESIQRVDRPQSGRFPRPDGTFDYKESLIRECDTSIREPSRHIATGTGEQGNRGTGEEKTSSPAAPSRPTAYPNEFEQWWQHYPRKTGKGAAAKAWKAARRKVAAATLLDAVIRYASDENLPEPNFIPHAATWLNGGRWDDGPLPPRRPSTLTTREQSQAGWDQLRPSNQQPALGA